MLSKDLSNIENSKDVTNKSLTRKKNINIYREIGEESGGIFGDMVKQISKSKIFQRKTNFRPSLKMQYTKLKF